MDQQQVTELKKNRAKFKDQAEVFEALLRSPGWAFYEELINSQIARRMEGLINPTPTAGALESEHNKGAVYGLTQARDLPRVTVAAWKEFVKSSGPATDGDEDVD